MYPAVLLMYFISAAVILLVSLALIVHDNSHMKVVRLSALGTGRLYPPGNIPVLISVRKVAGSIPDDVIGFFH
jgi:hypothetical protein